MEAEPMADRVNWFGAIPTTSFEVDLTPDEALDRLEDETCRPALSGGPLIPDRRFVGVFRGDRFTVRQRPFGRRPMPSLRGDVEATADGSRVTLRVDPPVFFWLMLLLTPAFVFYWALLVVMLRPDLGRFPEPLLAAAAVVPAGAVWALGLYVNRRLARQLAAEFRGVFARETIEDAVLVREAA
jgi:hypothetical protein